MLRILSPHSIIIHLRIFLSLYNSFLLLAGLWLSYSYKSFLPLWEIKKYSYAVSEKSYFYDLEGQPGGICIINWLLLDMWTKLKKKTP